MWGNILVFQSRTQVLVNWREFLTVKEKRENLLEEAGKKYLNALKYVEPTSILYSLSQKTPKNRDLVAIMQAYQVDPSMSNFDESISYFLSDSSLTLIFQEFSKSVSKLNLNSSLMISPNALTNPLPCLSELDLSDSNANDEFLKQISKNCKNLKILRISSTKVNLFPVGETMEKLEELNLQECKKLSNVALGNIGTYCPQLKSLLLSGTNVGEEAFIGLLKSCKEINNLDISNCKKLSSDSVILSIARSLPDLQSVNLGNLLFSKESFSAIPASCKKISSIKLAGMSHLHKRNISHSRLCTNNRLEHH